MKTKGQTWQANFIIPSSSEYVEGEWEGTKGKDKETWHGSEKEREQCESETAERAGEKGKRSCPLKVEIDLCEPIQSRANLLS